MGGKEILERVNSLLPGHADIGESRFEAANVVIFTKNFDFLMRAHEYLREIAKEVKLRVEARADRSLLVPPEEAETKIRVICEKAVITDIFFDTYGSKVIIEVKRPSEILGNGAEKLQEIRRKTAWTPVIQREPPRKSSIITTIRKILTQNSKERANFLNNAGMRIYGEGKETTWVRTSFLGAGWEVGRSAIFLQTDESRILMDCGINVGNKDKAFPILDAPEVNLARLDAVVISHPHMDHIGFVPFLFKYGYKGPVYMTPPTLPIGVLVQLDSIEIAYKEGGSAPYSSKEVEQMVLNTITMPYEEVTNVTPDTRITMYNAGHMLGSAVIHAHIGEGFYNLVYTGDMKFSESRLHEAAVNKFPRVEAVIIESTYGGEKNIQPPRKESEKKLMDTIIETVDKGGKVLIPTLGAGRAQEVMLMVEEAARKKILPEVPFYVDGMLWDATAIYTTYPEYLHRNIRKRVFSTEENPLLDPMFQKVGGQKERENVVSEAGSSIIMATSGMLTGGPSVFYLSKLAFYEQNSIVFISYQGEGTLGRVVQKKPREVQISHRERIPLNMNVVTVDGFSAHSDRKELMNYISTMEPRPGIVLPVHGDQGRVAEFASAIRRNLRISTKVPHNLDAIRLK